MPRNAAPKLSLKWKFKAWWDGYESAEMEEKLNRLRQTSLQKLTADNNKKKEKTASSASIWNTSRINVAQLIWGDGFCGPGGREYVIHMSKLLALQPSQSAIVIGAGLGGPSRVLAEEFGVWINAYESSSELAARGMQLTTDQGLEKKSPILHKNLNQVTEFDRQFDRAYSKDTFFTIENKTNLLRILYLHLKENGLFLLTDYVVKDSQSFHHPDIKEWLKNEPLPPFPVTQNSMERHFEDSGFNVRVSEDITENYIQIISDAWSGANITNNGLSQMDEDSPEEKKAQMQSLLQEAELWHRRTKALRSGELKICRYLTHKPSSK
jgi:hypothetical protein